MEVSLTINFTLTIQTHFWVSKWPNFFTKR